MPAIATTSLWPIAVPAVTRVAVTQEIRNAGPVGLLVAKLLVAEPLITGLFVIQI
jgi:hypothetical protein